MPDLGRSEAIEGAFLKAFRTEMTAAAHDTLVETYIWANSTGYGRREQLRPAAEEWAKKIEGAGAAMDVLRVVAEARACPKCGR